MRSFSQASTKGKRVVGKRGRKKILMAFKGEEQHKVVALGCSSSNSSQEDEAHQTTKLGDSLGVTIGDNEVEIIQKLIEVETLETGGKIVTS
ncbi:hypothetical protein AAC387_Pa03g2523 [Persea americana]